MNNRASSDNFVFSPQKSHTGRGTNPPLLKSLAKAEGLQYSLKDAVLQGNFRIGEGADSVPTNIIALQISSRKAL